VGGQTHRPSRFIPRQRALTKEEEDEEPLNITFFYGETKFTTLKFRKYLHVLLAKVFFFEVFLYYIQTLSSFFVQSMELSLGR
jgi:hypothetical protein